VEITRLLVRIAPSPAGVKRQAAEVGEGDPPERFSQAYQELIRSALRPSLLMVIADLTNEGHLDEVVAGSKGLTACWQACCMLLEAELGRWYIRGGCVAQ